MYKLFYDEVTGTHFVANDVEVFTQLKLLEVQLMRRGYFTLNEYCTAIGLPKEEPFSDDIEFSIWEFDLPYIFDIDNIYYSSVDAVSIGINVMVGPYLNTMINRTNNRSPNRK